MKHLIIIIFSILILNSCSSDDELKDLLNVFGRCLFDPKHLISCVLIDERYPLIYEKLIL